MTHFGSESEADWRPNGKSATYREHGWSFLGSGSYRECYLSPTGVVYKYDYNDSQSYGNRAEWGNYSYLYAHRENIPKRIRLPRAYLWDFGRYAVIAMEYIEGISLSLCTLEECICGNISPIPGVCANRYVDSHLSEYGLEDIWAENVIIDAQKCLVPIDFGM